MVERPHLFHPHLHPHPHPHPYPQQEVHPTSYQLAKAATTIAVGGSSLILSGLILVATVIGLTLATPVFVILSPVLVPAIMTVFMLTGGVVTSGELGAVAITVFGWMYKYIRGKRPPGADKIEQAKMTIATKAKEMKEYGQQNLPSAQAS